MIETVQSSTYATQAMSERYTNVPYSKLDCQAFVEEVLKDCGVRKPDGTPYNWKGSNSMWRNALKWKGTISECLTEFGCIPLGAWVFIVKHDGGEKDKGYNDNEGNASHVGIYCKDTGEQVRDSTKTKKRDGVGYRVLDGFTHVGLPKMITYLTPQTDEDEALTAVNVIRSENSTDEEWLKALKTLTKYMKGV